MPLGYAVGSIAGVNLEDAGGTPCKVLVLDGANFLSTLTAVNAFAADGTVYTQVMTPVAGVAFGARAEFIPPDVLNGIVAAVMAAVGGSDNFNVTLVDDIHSISVDCVPDFASGWLKYPAQRTNPDVIKDIEFRFITV
jgi:hypothetical protein